MSSHCEGKWEEAAANSLKSLAEDVQHGGWSGAGEQVEEGVGGVRGGGRNGEEEECQFTQRQYCSYRMRSPPKLRVSLNIC